jgi:hypothetical protein
MTLKDNNKCERNTSQILFTCLTAKIMSKWIHGQWKIWDMEPFHSSLQSFNYWIHANTQKIFGNSFISQLPFTNVLLKQLEEMKMKLEKYAMRTNRCFKLKNLSHGLMFFARVSSTIKDANLSQRLS